MSLPKCLWFAGVLAVTLVACIPPPPQNIAPIVDLQNFETIKNKHRSLPDSLDPLTLNFCIQVGLQNSPSYLAKAQAVSAAWARYYQSLSGYLPNLTLDGGYNGNTTKQNTRATYTGNVANVGLSAQYLIFNGLVREMNMLSAEASGRQAEHLNTDARRILIRAIGLAYTQIQLYREEVCIQKQNVQCNLELIQQAEKQFEVGATALADLLYWRIKYNDSEISLIQARFNERVARYMLAELMGLTDGEIPSLPYTEEQLAEMSSQDPKQPISNYPDDRTFPRIHELNSYVLSDVNVYLDAALKNRPDLKAYREALKQSEYSLISQYGGFMPTVYATANAGLGSSIYTNSGDAYSRNVGWGVTASWNLFEGFATWNRVREAQANLEISRYDVAASWINVVSEVRQAHANYQRFHEELIIAKERLKSATRAYEIVLDQYKQGAIEVVRVNESLFDRITSEIEVARYMINLFSAQITLEAAAAYNI